MSLHKRIFFILILLIFIPIFFHSYSFVPYQGSTKKIITDHFVILFPKQYEKTARKTATYAEDIHEKINEFMKWKPKLRTTIVISDETDLPNGMAVTFYRNTIYLYIAPLDLQKNLRSFEDPLYSLILHEYTHILHLDQIRGGAWFWRVMYGKLYCPNSGTFRWYIEGVAVLTETLYAEGGRLKSSYNQALISAAAKQKMIPSFDKLVMPVVDWPHGEAVYHYGARFVEYIYNQYGEEKFQEFFVDISNDFWPFILQFVLKFKKIYGKSLKELWNEWKEYEEEQVELYPDSSYTSNKLTNLKGSISSFDKGDDFFIIASNSYKNDKYLYKLNNNGTLNKIYLANFKSVSLTNNENYILCTSITKYPGSFSYTNLYSINLKTKIRKKLTDLKRINYVSFAKNNPNGVFVAHSGSTSKLFKAKFIDGKLDNIHEIKIPSEIIFIDAPKINADGDKAVFAARTQDNTFRLFLFNLEDNSIILLDDSLEGQNARWIDNQTISYIAFDGYSDSIYSFSISNKTSKKIFSSSGSILDAIIVDNNVYYIEYTIDGEELFSDNISETSEVIENNYNNISTIADTNINPFNMKFRDEEWEISNYMGFRYLYPSIWGLLPFQMSSSINYSLGNGSFGIPFYGPKFFIYNILPQGRFSYYFDVGLDYIKLYPVNNLSLNLKLPFINISYYWSNWKGGSKYLFDNIWYEQKYLNDFPIKFSNTLSVNNTYSFADGFNLFWNISTSHIFNQYNFDLNKTANFLNLMESIGFSYIKPRNKSTRWDRGVYIKLTFLQYPPLLDNYLINLIRGKIEGRIPCGKAFYFINIESGIETLFQNVYKVDSDIYRFSESFIGSSSGDSSNSLSIIDTKAFPSIITLSSFGSVFISLDTGFDITIYKKSKYWHFATLGFKEFYIKPYTEFVYIYNVYFNHKSILFDGVLELAIDLFAAYGNITVTMINGGALGYRLGDSLPAWSVFSYFKVGL